MKPIELRSDTFTKPTQAMRTVIANANVGDDVYGEDPSINSLEKKVAKLLGKQAALFVPSGTMANQIAIKVFTQPGDEVLVGAFAHNRFFECGAAGFISGVQMTGIKGDGRFSAQEFTHAYHPPGSHYAPSKLLCIENTHNVSGGLVWPQEQLEELVASANELGVKTHMDGARLWNACVYSGSSPASLCDGFDSVSVCLSKGLGAPVGSVLAASQEVIEKCRRFRRMLGGGMRQCGFLAAAGIYAIDHHIERLSEDHKNALLLAQGINDLTGFDVDLDKVQTNILMVHCHRKNAFELQMQARQKSLMFFPLNDSYFRLVTHLDVSEAQCLEAIKILAKLS